MSAVFTLYYIQRPDTRKWELFSGDLCMDANIAEMLMAATPCVGKSTMKRIRAYANNIAKLVHNP